jgi:hypothetical protein
LERQLYKRKGKSGGALEAAAAMVKVARGDIGG